MTASIHHGGVFWPDDGELATLKWWRTAAWPGGPSYGALVGKLRPMLRAALLLGYEVISINLGSGEGVSGEGEWHTIDRLTLDLVPGEEESISKLAKGRTLWLETMSIADRMDGECGSYGIEFDFGQFGSEVTTSEAFADIVGAIESTVSRAVEALAAAIPDEPEPKLPRHNGSGLLWIFDPGYQRGLGAAGTEMGAVVASLVADREAFLLGQIYAERSEHDGGDESAPANLQFLLASQASYLSSLITSPEQRHTWVWQELLADLQARGDAHRLWQEERTRFTGAAAPTWLDVLARLIRLGVVLVDGLYDPPHVPFPVAASASGDPVSSITLTMWGSQTITLRRQTVFADGANVGLIGSVAWDYAPGIAKVPPTLILVAGRGVAIDYLGRLEEPEPDVGGRPWRVEIFRVQDDRMVPRLGSRIDPATLLGTSEIVPLANECVFEPDAVLPAEAEFAPQILVKPQRHGVRLVYPISGGVIPTSAFGPISGQDAPCVLELTVDPKSGTAAYAIDAYYHTDEFMNLPANVSFSGGVHVCVWVIGDVTIRSSNSTNVSAPRRGEPSVVHGFSSAHQFVAELWEVVTPAIGSAGRHPLPRPWSAELAVTGWTDMFPPTAWDLMAQEMWNGLVNQTIQEFLSPNRDDVLMIPAPHVSYDSDAQRASWHDPASGADYLLRPAAHQRATFGETDSLFFDVLDTGLGLVPIVGDIVDIAEVIYVWQTGRDRWGRPVTDYELAQMMFFAVVPFVSSSFLQAAAFVLSGLPQLVVETLHARLFTPAPADSSYPVSQAQAALVDAGVLRNGSPAANSEQRRQAAAALMTQLAGDAQSREDSPAWALATRLIGGTPDGWVSVDDLLSDDAAGFRGASLQIPYTRFLRDNPGIGPIDWLEALDG